MLHARLLAAAGPRPEDAGDARRALRQPAAARHVQAARAGGQAQARRGAQGVPARRRGLVVAGRVGGVAGRDGGEGDQHRAHGQAPEEEEGR